MSTANKQPKKELVRLVIGGVVILFLVLIVVLQNLSERGITLWQTREEVLDAKRVLLRSQNQLQELINDIEQLNIAQKNFKGDNQKYWLVERDGKAEGNIQKVVEKAAAASGLKLSSLSNLRSQKIGEYGVLYEMTITAVAPIKPVAQFIEKLKKVTPKFYWQSCSIRPKVPAGGDEVRFQGALVFVCVVDGELVTMLME